MTTRRIFPTVGVLFLAWLSATVASAGQPAEPLLVFAGDGIRIVVLESQGDGEAMTGEIRVGRAAYPFTGQFDEDDDELFVGSFKANGKTFQLRGRQTLDDGVLDFETGGKKYRLQPIEGGDDPSAAGTTLPRGGADGNPLGGGSEAVADAKPPADDVAPTAERRAPPPEDRPEAPVAPNAPVARNETPDAPAARDEGRAAPSAGVGEALPSQMKLKIVEFPDVSMGNVGAYRMMVPEGWTSEGRIEWRGQPTPFPQRMISVTSRDGCGMEFPPLFNFQYIEYTQQGIEQARQFGQQIEPRQGNPPPSDAGEWVAGMLSQRQGASRVRVVNQERDRRSEQAYVDQITRAGGQPVGETQAWVVRVSYDLSGTPMTEETTVMFHISPPVRAENFFVQDWMAIVDVSSRAPAAKFETMRPIFQMMYRSLRPDPRWYTQSMEIRTQMLRQQTQDMIAELRRRADAYNSQLSDDQMQAYRAKTNADDEAQRMRLNSIAETHDYADKDGTRVNVPIHYKTVFGDGNGNYVLTNDSYQPGGQFVELKQWK